MTQMKSSDPAYWMLFDGVTSTPVVYNENCYICRDPEYSQMGLPLCFPCFLCKAHVQVDGNMKCDNGHIQPMEPEEEVELRKEYG